MNRKEWKKFHKKFGRNKIKRLKAQLKQGHAMQRRPQEIKTRRASI